MGQLKNFFDKVTVADLDIASEEGIEILTPADAVLVQANTPKGGIQETKDEE